MLQRPLRAFRQAVIGAIDRSSHRIRHTSTKDMLLRGMARVMFVVYLVVTITSLSLFNCRRVAPGEYRMEAEPGAKCYTTSWYLSVFLLAVPALCCVTIGMPVLILWKAKPWSQQHRQHVLEQHSLFHRTGAYAVAAGSPVALQSDELSPLRPRSHRGRLAKLTEVMLMDTRFYRPGVRSWGHSVFLFRRAAAAALFVALFDRPVLRQLGVFCLMLVFLLLQWAVAPFATRGSNRLAAVLLSVVVLVAGLELCRVSLSEREWWKHGCAVLWVFTLLFVSCVSLAVRREYGDDASDDPIAEGLTWAIMVALGLPLITLCVFGAYGACQKITVL